MNVSSARSIERIDSYLPTKLMGMVRFLGVFILGAIFSSSCIALDIVELEDHGKTTKFGYYMVHFKFDDPDNEYPFNKARILLASVDTVIKSDSKGEYKLGVYLGYKDTSYSLHIVNVEFTDKENKHWGPGYLFSSTWSVYPRGRTTERQNIELPYKHPTMANLMAWTKMGTSEFGKQSASDGLAQIDPEYVDEGCIKYEGDEYDFDETYELMLCPASKMVQLRYGVFATTYESELNWIKASVSSLEMQLKPHYSETKQMGAFSTKIYRLRTSAKAYAIYIIEDTDCTMSDKICYQGFITIKWAYLD